jgi:hypothetical protein
MTIDDVMTLAAEYRDASTFSGQCVAKKNLRAAILALLDAEAEECAISVALTRIESQGDAGHDRGVSGWMTKAEERIRYRIAARKGGNDD